MELRPFRAIRFTPELIQRRGLEALITPIRAEVLAPAGAGSSAAAPENAARLTAPETDASGAETFKQWMAEGILWKERRPGLWLYRQMLSAGGAPRVLRFLIGLVRVDPAGHVELTEETPAPDERDRRLARLREMKADFEPALILTRAPLTAALATTRKPELSATDAEGVRHDALRIEDFAEHVELQGLVKNAEASLAEGREGWEAARELARDPNAAKLPGVKYKLCAILEEAALADLEHPPRLYAGLWGFSVEDPVY